MERLRRINPALLIAYAFAFLIAAVIIAIPSRTWIVNLATDDAMYYPVVAHNIVSGLGSTYDGITRTNGYQPLWAWLQMPMAVVAGGQNPMLYLWFIKLLIAGVVVLALLVWGRLILRLCDSAMMAATFVVLLGTYWWGIYTLYGGMETGLVVLMLGTSLTFAHRLLTVRTPSSAALFGVALAGCFLARLDAAFFVAVLGLVMLVRLGRSPRLQAGWILPAIALPAPYLLWNLTNFGNVVPVSGLRKTVSHVDFGEQFATLASFAQGKFAKLAGLVPPAAIVAILLVAALAVWVIRVPLWQRIRKLDLLLVVPAAAVLHFGYTATFMTEADVYWYQYAEYMTIFLIAAVAVAVASDLLKGAKFGKVLQWTPFAAVCAATSAVLIGYVPHALPNMVNLRSYEAATWAKNNVADENPRFGMIDPGVFRFVSGIDTVALNGLAGDKNMMNLCLERKPAEIVRQYGVDYVVVFAVDKEIQKVPKEYVLFRSQPLTYSGTSGRLVIVGQGFRDGMNAFILREPR